MAPFTYSKLVADVEQLRALFVSLENLAKTEAQSGRGLDILIQIVLRCHQVHERHILQEMLAKSSRLAADLKIKVCTTVSKLAHYSALSRFLVQAAQKYPVFRQVQVSAVKFGPPHLSITRLDCMTADIIQKRLIGPKLEKIASKCSIAWSRSIEDHVCQEATTPVPVHAEIQLLMHYERSPCDLPPRVIYSSKQACFLCNLFFKIHGKLTVPSTHGRLYEKWALPAGIECVRDDHEAMLTTLWKFCLSNRTYTSTRNSLQKQATPRPEREHDPPLCSLFTIYSVQGQRC